MRKHCIILVAASLVLAGCVKVELLQKEPASSVSQKDLINFVAGADVSVGVVPDSSEIASAEMPEDVSSLTKTVIVESAVHWVAGSSPDEVMIFGKDVSGQAKVSGYAAAASGEVTALNWNRNIRGAEGAFVKDDTPEYALYPCDADATIDGSVITFKLPENQVYTTDSFGSGANAAVGKVIKDGTSGNISFRNVCGYLKLQLSVASGDAATVGKIILSANGQEKLWGTFTVDASSNAPSAVYKTGASDGGGSLTLDCPGGTALSDDPGSPTAFFFVVPAGALSSGFMARVYSLEGHLLTTLSTSKDKTIARSTLKKMAGRSFDWIPAAYQEKAYLESNGRQCLDTGYGSKKGFRFTTAFSFLGFNEWDCNPGICGVGNIPDDNSSFRYTALDYYTDDIGELRYMYNSKETAGDVPVEEQTYDIDVSFIPGNRHFKVNGESRSLSLSLYNVRLEHSASFIGVHMVSDETGGYSYIPGPSARWYSCDMYDDENDIIRHFIPAYCPRGSEGHRYGMYDVLGDTFFTNVYTGPGACDFSSGSGSLTEMDPSLVFESFAVPGGETLGKAHKTTTICVPAGTDLTGMVATFSTNADKVCVGNTELVSGVTPCDYSKEVTFTLWKGVKWNKCIVKIYADTLPTLWIETPDYAAVTSKDDWMEGASVRLYSPEDGLVELGSSQIKGRGNSTWGYPKKPYTIKLDKKASVLGMPKDKRWNLLANWMDRTDMRNEIAFQLGRISPGLAWTPKGKFVELIMNGKFVGNYYLCEHIKISSDRVNITAIDEDNPTDLTGGYLLEFDSYYDETNRFKSSLKMPINVKDPDWTDGFSISYIRSWINSLESMLTSSGISTSGYTDYLDIDSFIDWWFVHEMTGNPEPQHPKSSYMYKDSDSVSDHKIHAGPCWDFDFETFRLETDWKLKEAIWYPYLFKDPAFVARLKEKWAAQKASYKEVADIYIDAVAAQIAASVGVDKTIWPCTSTTNGDETLSFEDAVTRMKTSLSDKIAWMDIQISRF